MQWFRPNCLHRIEVTLGVSSICYGVNHPVDAISPSMFHKQNMCHEHVLWNNFRPEPQGKYHSSAGELHKHRQRHKGPKHSSLSFFNFLNQMSTTSTAITSRRQLWQPPIAVDTFNKLYWVDIFTRQSLVSHGSTKWIRVWPSECQIRQPNAMIGIESDNNCAGCDEDELHKLFCNQIAIWKMSSGRK